MHMHVRIYMHALNCRRYLSSLSLYVGEVLLAELIDPALRYTSHLTWHAAKGILWQWRPEHQRSLLHATTCLTRRNGSLRACITRYSGTAIFLIELYCRGLLYSIFISECEGVCTILQRWRITTFAARVWQFSFYKIWVIDLWRTYYCRLRLMAPCSQISNRSCSSI